VISDTMARTMFPSGSPIGHRYGVGGPQHANDLEVIGVVKNVKFGSLQEDQQTLDYFPVTQQMRYLNDFEVRYTGSLDAALPAVRRAIHDVDPNLPISNVTTLDEQVGRSITNQRLVAQLSTFFGLLAVFLSCIGIYGLMSYVVTRRTNEIGIRMALGAERSHVHWLVMREILLLAALGIAVGVPAALAGNRLISSMLFGVRPADPPSLLAAVVILLIVAVMAGHLPARRASLVDPIVALRCE
jgi:ABC-type antimicrobial peptide transport system permease subunit